MPGLGVINLGITIKGTGIVGANQIKTKVKRVMWQYFLNNWCKIMTTWYRKYIPEDTGRLLRDFIATAYSSTPTSLKIGAPNTPYASYVNQMVGVNWTKKTSKEQFYGEAAAFGYSIIKPLLARAVQDAGIPQKMGLTAEQAALAIFG